MAQVALLQLGAGHRLREGLDEQLLAQLPIRHDVGVERIVWSSDYPHISADWPYSWRTIQASMSGVPREERDLILAGKTVAAKSALKLGLVDDLVPTEKLLNTALAKVDRAARKPRRSAPLATCQNQSPAGHGHARIAETFSS